MKPVNILSTQSSSRKESVSSIMLLSAVYFQTSKHSHFAVGRGAGSLRSVTVEV